MNDKKSNSPETSSLKESFIIKTLNMNTVMCYEMKYAGAAREAMAKIHQLLHAENLDSISVHNDVISNVNVCPVNGIKRLRIAINQVLPIKGIDQYSHFVQKTSRRYICSRDL